MEVSLSRWPGKILDTPAWLFLRGVVRGAHIAGAFWSFGTMFLAATLLRHHRLSGLKTMVWMSLGLALLAGLSWFLLQTADFADAQSFGDISAAIPIVVKDTRFGTLLIGRCAALILASLLFQAGWTRPAALIAGAAVVAESWLSHGGAMNGLTGTILLAVSMAHLAAAAIWLGSLPALHFAIKTLPADAAAPLARNFSPIGIACVVLITATAVIQYFFLIGRPADLIDTGYGLTASFKIIALVSLVTLAALNRTRFTPRLPASRAQLLRSINAEIAIGLVTLLAAGLILQLEPPAMAMMG
jgi:putative copper resistance protein D